MPDISNQTEYAEYEQVVREFRLRYQHISTDSEEFFSWQGCDCCKSHLGNTFVTSAAQNRETGDVETGMRICVDCQYYLEYGRLDDVTMNRLAQVVDEQAESAPDWKHSAQFMTEFDPSKAGPGLGE